MPKIVNKKWKEFKYENVPFNPIPKTQFITMLDKIKYKNPDKTKQARALAILGYYTAMRPTEIVNLKPRQLEQPKQRQHYNIYYTSAKGGKQGRVSIVKDELTKEAFEYIKKVFPDAYCFYYFRAEKKNKVSWKKKINVQTLKGGIEEQTLTQTKVYPREAARLRYFAEKWFGFPFYYFRHNRLSDIAKNGGTREDILNFKLGKTYASVEPYLKYSEETTIKNVKLAKPTG